MYKATFYWTRSGRKPVKEFLEEQEKDARGKLIDSILYLEQEGYRLHRPRAAKITDKMYELRVEYSPNNYRILYYYCVNNYIVLLHAFKKKSNELKSRDIDTAQTRMNDFNERIAKGDVRI